MLLKQLQKHPGYVYVRACPGREWRIRITGLATWCSTRLLNSPRHRVQRQFFIPFRCSHRHPRRRSSVEVQTPFLSRVSRSCSLSELMTQGFFLLRTNRIQRPGGRISCWPLTDHVIFAAAEVKGYIFWSSDYYIGGGKGRGCAGTAESEAIRVNKGVWWASAYGDVVDP